MHKTQILISQKLQYFKKTHYLFSLTNIFINLGTKHAVGQYNVS